MEESQTSKSGTNPRDSVGLRRNKETEAQLLRCLIIVENRDPWLQQKRVLHCCTWSEAHVDGPECHIFVWSLTAGLYLSSLEGENSSVDTHERTEQQQCHSTNKEDIHGREAGEEWVGAQGGKEGFVQRYSTPHWCRSWLDSTQRFHRWASVYVKTHELIKGYALSPTVGKWKIQVGF